VTAGSGKEPEGTRLLVQDYIDKPLLLDGHKFHLRLYVLITSVNPLCCFVYRDGILYMAGEKYLTPADDNLVRIVGNLIILFFLYYDPLRRIEIHCKYKH
jgi:Tubulin-tyrosine ligase family